MIRQLTEHEVNEVNAALDIVVVDDPGPGGAKKT